MNLVIDQGNTICKVAIYQGETLVKFVEEQKFEIQYLNQLLAEYASVKSAIYSSVSFRDEEMLQFLQERLDFVLDLSSDTAVPLQIDYDRASLGSDRLAAVVSALAYAGEEAEILVIDIGTAITIERISKGVFLGGNISPGVAPRLKALNSYTSRLPLLTKVEQAEGLGLDTASAIERGVLRGVVYEIEGYIRSIREEHPDAQVFMTGGYSVLLSSFLEEEVILKKDLVLYGLNHILAYNYNVR